MLLKSLYSDIREIRVHSALRVEVQKSYGAETSSLGVTAGNLYTVYGVQVNDGTVSYYLADDDYPVVPYPLAYPAPLFEIVDRRVSSCWSFEFCADELRPSQLLLTFEEWACDPEFYDRLIDFSDHEAEIFRSRKMFMDREFSGLAASDR